MARVRSRLTTAVLAAGLAFGASGCAAAGLAATGAATGGLILWRMKSGGAMSEQNLRRETGRFLQLDPDTISVYNIDRGATQVSWMATTPNGVYKCDADDMVRRPSCIKQGGLGRLTF